ncbi:hypothetical protein H2199_006094 [Coniosporium tulheliwenetii]|uniref:Uncharacterized protein n=1 Tax=Coniosporium tulheliwenetii TaxID=3383036 RepID=A0ACC2YXG0_9PEZI|nr:hypothetical protein H2199_006094 [Cladosporium sp. JES 115]
MTSRIANTETPTMPTTSTLPTPTTSNTLLFLLLFIPAFFPGLFIGLLKLPSAPSLLLPQPPPTAPRLLPPTATQHVLVPKTLSLPPKSRGSYLVTSDIEKQLPELKNYKTGLLNLFLQHTSAALSLNENWDSEVREDMTDALERIVPYDKAGKLYRHAAEGRMICL